MKQITLTNAEATRLFLVLEELYKDNDSKSYVANGKHPAWKHSAFISSVGMCDLNSIMNKLVGGHQ